MTTNKPPYSETNVLSKHGSHAKTDQTSGCEDRPSAQSALPTAAGATGNAIDDEILAAVRDYGHAAWEYGFRSEPGSMGTAPYVQALEKKKKAKEDALLALMQKRLADPGLLPSDRGQEAMMNTMAEERSDEPTVSHLDGRMRAAQVMPEIIRSILVRCRNFIDTTKVPAYPAGADLADEIDDVLLAAHPTGAQQPGAAGLIGALEDAQQAINSMKVEAETAAQGDEQMMLEACETISNEGLQADMAIRAALASHGQAPAQAAPESFLEIPDVQDESGINSHYSRELVLECINAALAARGQAPAQAATQSELVATMLDALKHAQKVLNHNNLQLECAPINAAILAAKAAPAAVAGPSRDLHPEKCPITGRPFFMTLDHPELGDVPTYGGPYDSYTIPAPEGEPTDPWHERELRSERYDHDAGWWVEGGEPIPLRIVHEDVLFELQEDALAAAPTTQPAPDEIINMAREQGLPETETEGVFRVNVDDLGRIFASYRAARAPADSVLEDAARLDWLDQQCEAYGFQDIHEGNRWEISGPYANVRVAIDAERAAQEGKKP